MRVLIETVGSAGDVHPFVAVGQALQARGHEVVLFSNEHFRDVVETAALRFVSTSTEANYDEITSDPDLWHPTRGPVVVLRNTVANLLAPSVEAILAEDPDDETVIVAPTLGFAGRCAAELSGVPFVRAHLQPTAFRSVHHAPRLPGLWMPELTPAWWKRLLYRISDAIIDQVVGEHLNGYRAVKGLPPVRRVFDDWIQQADALLALYPKWFAPPQPDAPAGVHHSGFLLFDRADQEALDPDLAAWLRDGEPPVVFTHGSANRHGAAFFESSAGVARTLGVRALLVTREEGAVEYLTDSGVRHASYVPFSAILPHAAAFVHHGGVGTTAQGLAAGVPQLVVPMGFDQPDNADRVVRLRAGGRIPARRYRLRTATALLRRILDDAYMRDAARDLSTRIDSGAAARIAAEIVESALTRRSARAPS
jgi:UDP:flavonoid glycosyltransferase YjiC (YdhE family)